MAFQKIDDRTILVTSHEQLPTFPDRPEPERKEDPWLTYKQTLKRFGWSDADYEEAQQHGFPISAKRPRRLYGVDLVWRESWLDRWANEQRESANAKMRLVG